MKRPYGRTRKEENMPRRILVIGSAEWSDAPAAKRALRRVEEVYQGPYVLVCDMSDGAPRYAAAAARTLGWSIEPHEVDPSKCGPDCPDHRRRGGLTGDYCPTYRHRSTIAQLATGPDLVIALLRPRREGKAVRIGQVEVRSRGIALWEFTQRRGA